MGSMEHQEYSKSIEKMVLFPFLFEYKKESCRQEFWEGKKKTQEWKSESN